MGFGENMMDILNSDVHWKAPDGDKNKKDKEEKPQYGITERPLNEAAKKEFEANRKAQEEKKKKAEADGQKSSTWKRPQPEDMAVEKRGEVAVEKFKPKPEQKPNPKIVEPEKKPQPEQKEPKAEKVVIADITAVVDRYARDLARVKVNEEINKSGFLRRSWYRLTESGYEKKFFDEAKAEILKNRNLLSEIEVRFARKSQGKPLYTGDENRHYEILDKAIEAYMEEIVDSSKEVKQEAYHDAAIDSAAAAVIADFCTGRINDRKVFEETVESNVINKYLGHQLQTGKDRMYATSLWQLAQDYKKRFEDMVKEGKKEYGPENGENIRNFLERGLKLDIKLGQKGADLYQKRPEEVMKWYETVVDFTQMPFFKNSRLGRGVGKVLANPVFYAATGGLIGRYGTRALGAKAGIAALGTAFGMATGTLIGAGLFAGIYLGIRAIREKRRDIQRREAQAVLGLQGKETHELKNARDLIKQLEELDKKDAALSEEEKKMVAEMQARVDIQSRYGVDLIGVGKEEGQNYKTKLIAETDLRIALKKFLEDKKDAQGNDIEGSGRWKNFGATKEQAKDEYLKMIGAAERQLANEIEKVNEDVAREVSNRGDKVAALGVVITLVAGAFAPYLKEKALEGLDHILGTHWASNKTQYVEEFAHKVKELFKGGHQEAVAASSAGAVGGATLEQVAQGHPRSLTEYLHDLKGHIIGGEVQQIHNHDYYDNALPGESNHLHRLNELKLFTHADSHGNIQIRVPLEQGGSWLDHGHIKLADIDQAFQDGHIKLLLMPGGAHAHEAIVLNIDPQTHELIIPDNLKYLFDAVTGQPKGNVLMGVAEQVNVRADGSFDYNWVSATVGKGAPLTDFGTTVSETIAHSAPGVVSPTDFEGPWTIAGYRREKNKDSEFARKERMGRLYSETVEGTQKGEKASPQDSVIETAPVTQGGGKKNIDKLSEQKKNKIQTAEGGGGGGEAEALEIGDVDDLTPEQQQQLRAKIKSALQKKGNRGAKDNKRPQSGPKREQGMSGNAGSKPESKNGKKDKGNRKERTQRKEIEIVTPIGIKTAYQYVKNINFDRALNLQDLDRNKALGRLDKALQLLKSSKIKLPKGEWNFVFVNPGQTATSKRAAGERSPISSFEIPLHMSPQGMANFLEKQFAVELKRQIEPKKEKVLGKKKVSKQRERNKTRKKPKKVPAKTKKLSKKKAKS